MNSVLPGQLEVLSTELTAKHGALLFTKAELEAFNEIAKECGAKPWDVTGFDIANV